MGNASYSNRYDYIFLSNLPSFYKVRLWNELGRVKSILALFLNDTERTRNADFFSETPTFDYLTIGSNSILSVCKLLKTLLGVDYNRLIIGGWDSIECFVAAFLSSKKKNAVICESSCYEYSPNFIKDFVKKSFLRRITIAYTPGISQGHLLELLGFKGRVVYSGGCGLLNYSKQPLFEKRNSISKFLFVGRLVPEKNLELLISVFNKTPDLSLTIIGFGELEENLKQIASSNIHFLGAMPNKELDYYYKRADCFILPSKSEVWGLVVEEALNNGCPVIVSDKVGCNVDLVTPDTGIVFQYNNEASLLDAINQIRDLRFYNRLRLGVSRLDFIRRAQMQVDAFLQ